MSFNLVLAHILYLPYVFFLLTAVTLVLPSKLTFRGQAIWLAFLLVCHSKFFWFAVLGGDAFNPELPAAVIWAWNGLHSGSMILSLLALATAFFRFRAKMWLLPLVAWGASVWGLYGGLRVPDVHEVELSFDNLPPALDGYRIAQLSDLHCSYAARRWRMAAVVEKTNALKPDLICLTGDLADGRVEKIAPYLAPIGGLRARDGVYACTGNHEYYSDYYGWMTHFYAKTENIRFLENECAYPHEGLALAGVPDKSGWERGLAAAPDPRLAFASATNGEFRVLLQHGPKGAEDNCREVGVDLQLSGHTHGGVAPLLRRFIGNLNGGYSRGLYSFAGSYLYVSPGSGQWAGFPMRLFNDSEITLLTLRRVEIIRSGT